MALVTRREFTVPPGGGRPNRFKSQQFSEAVLTEGEINVDCLVDSRLWKQRSDAVKDPDLAKDLLMGTDLGENMEFVDVRLGEPLFIQKKMIRSNGQEKFFPRKAHVFSSFNGMLIIGKN